MWIRSQDKETLIKCETFSVFQYVGEEEYRITNDVVQGYPLAKYSTKEKAMKVMDMFEKHIEYVNSTQGGGFVQPHTVYEVFIFPQDSEVEKWKTN